MHRRETRGAPASRARVAGVPSVLLERISRVTPFAILGLLLLAWALSSWGRDDSLVTVLATHLPAAAYCILALGAVVASVVKPSLPAGVAALACVFLAVVQLGGWTLPSRPAPAAAGYRALTWNVEQWSYGGAPLARAIAELEPDVFCLQEARSYGSYPDVEWQAFEAELPGYRLFRYGEMAIGTRWAVIEERRVPLHRELWRRPLLDLELEAPNGGRLRVLNAHLVYTGYYGKRPEALVMSARERRAQAERILQHLGASDQSTLLCGDLNAAPNSAALSLLRQRFSDAWQLRGLGFGMTSTVRWPLRRIDYLLVSGLEIGDISVLQRPLSDHRALTATFTLAPALAQADRGGGSEAAGQSVQ
jgi:endonuclease/exonuclease/phosphatase (EEP) superfamily protein YafD